MSTVAKPSPTAGPMAVTLQLGASRILNMFKPSYTSKSILPFLPLPVKYFLLFLLLVNYKSLPGIYHVRILFRVALLRLQRFSYFFRSKKAFKEWKLSLANVGVDPFTNLVSFKTVASPDDCDMYLHLNNASYAKSFDYARFKAALKGFLPFLKDAQGNAWFGLGATHFEYIKEIPMFTEYEVRIHISSWDSKWMYIVAHFVSKPKKGSKRVANSSAPKDLTSAVEFANVGVSKTSANLNESGNEDGQIASGTQTPAIGEPGKTQLRAAPRLDDGSVVHCIAVAQLCYKIGRITVPPALVMALSGFALSEAQWQEVESTRRRPGAMYKFLIGGWKDVRSEDRWWETSLEKFEETRSKNLAAVERVSDASSAVRSLL